MRRVNMYRRHCIPFMTINLWFLKLSIPEICPPNLITPIKSCTSFLLQSALQIRPVEINVNYHFFYIYQNINSSSDFYIPFKTSEPGFWLQTTNGLLKDCMVLHFIAKVSHSQSLYHPTSIPRVKDELRHNMKWVACLKRGNFFKGFCAY